MVDVTVIIINYNGAVFIEECIDSLLALKQYSPSFEVLLVDNASSDHSKEILKKYQDDIQIIYNQENTGFARANNQCLPIAKGRYLWLLNNDTCIPKNTDVFTPILSYLDSNEDAVGLSPKLLNADGSIQVQGSSLGSWRFYMKKTRQVPFLSGAALFIRTSFFKSIEGFDAALFFYNDDIDFAKQTKRHKKKLIYFPSISIIHFGGLSTQFRKLETIQEGYLGSLHLCKKFYPKWVYRIYHQLVHIDLNLKILYHGKCNSSPDHQKWLQNYKELKGKISL